MPKGVFAMHEAAGNQRFVSQSILHIREQFANPTPELIDAIGSGIGSTDVKSIEDKRVQLAAQFDEISKASQKELLRQDKHYVSRFDGVGLFQSALSKTFAAVPNLQGYGDWNPLWVITEIERFAYEVKGFMNRVHQDDAGKKQSVWAAIITEFLRLKTVDDRAPYPTGLPDSVTIPANCAVALLADWGGDNDAAKRVADVTRKRNPDIAVHLGDIYYGGTEAECRHFLNLWPMREAMNDMKSPIHTDGSWALNGNHEMYCGGEYFFKTVLPAFAQKQPFFCLENDSWRIIGLDTAYADGRLKPQSDSDPIFAQWNWLIDKLRSSKKATILLTHHQPVSAHQQEFKDSEPLRNDIEELLRLDGVGDDAIYGWFFGHEHRCAVYRDSVLKFNARLIGNGCIPHEVEKAKAADPGCTEVDFFNRREAAPGTNTAASMFAKLTFMGPKLQIEYVDETNLLWGQEAWDSTKKRLEGDPADRFAEYADVR
jgi:hypothetical protein